ncbi:unnamed protein product [Pleuronectes platessa]|uniref:Uncharacterized protein n=1 Tax=Pleuronectes platessa TaxID=8262 RepID=A0A9N7Z2H1_PLEPL|nr:unnamed protein product [Pleuronectes platessa]
MEDETGGGGLVRMLFRQPSPPRGLLTRPRQLMHLPVLSSSTPPRPRLARPSLSEGPAHPATKSFHSLLRGGCQSRTQSGCSVPGESFRVLGISPTHRQLQLHMNLMKTRPLFLCFFI